MKTRKRDLPLSTRYHLPDLGEALNCLPGRYPIVVGGLNTNMGWMKNPQNQQVTNFLDFFGLVDFLGHFRK